MEQDLKPTSITSILDLPVLPLRDIVVFPSNAVTLIVGRDKSMRAIEDAKLEKQEIFMVAQRNPDIDTPTVDDLYLVGTIGTILHSTTLPNGSMEIMVLGQRKARVASYYLDDHCLRAEVEPITEIALNELDAEGLRRLLIKQFQQYAHPDQRLSSKLFTLISTLTDPSYLVYAILGELRLKVAIKQSVLEIIDPKERVEKYMAIIESEIELLQVEDKIRSQVKKQMEKSQREYYLNEQMKAIQKELGSLENETSDIEKLEKQIADAGMTQEAIEKAYAEIKKLKMMPPMSAEATVSRNFLDALIHLPWKKRTRINADLAKAIQVLNEEHYGLEKVKERIIEFLAVQQRVKKLKGPILCLVGPPGVGKTSLARSIANATGRKYTRFSLGGVRDEAEIRGHRRTYIGSMPGKILQRMTKVGVRNPLFLLDEIDKMAMDFRGDPSSALLEVLDPEQNNTFNDHYLEIDYDLSDVMFICTANSLNIPGPLLDRMEVIRLSGYTEDEKINIAKQHLIPKQMSENGLKDSEIHISGGTIRSIIRYYTREAGVRSLEREIAKICRKVVTELLRTKGDKVREKILVTQRNVEKYLGIKRFRFGSTEGQDRVGQVSGLAWTEVGGELLTIEAAVVAGKGGITSTGHLGEVMQESIKAALTVVRNRALSLGIDENFYEKKDIHIHLPEGATPKDGPSAGAAMCTAIVSALTGIPVRADVAMTGEITLRGEVLPIGGLKEKLLAAHRGGITHVIIPIENERDLKDIPVNIKQDLHIHPMRWIEDVLKLALVKMPTPLTPNVTSLPNAEKKQRVSDTKTKTH
jgi:ATP-dependent Lon protease